MQSGMWEYFLNFIGPLEKRLLDQEREIVLKLQKKLNQQKNI